MIAAVLLLTTGCIGMGGDDVGDDSGDNLDKETNGPNDQTNSTDAADDHEHEPEPEPHTEERTGEVEQTNLVVGTSGAPANETFEIPEKAGPLVFNLSVDSGEINGEIFPPDCEDNSPNQQGAECSEDLDTYNSTEGQSAGDGGEATWETESPQAGNWTVELYKADPGSSSVPYTLTAFYIDVHGPSGDHHS